MGRRPRRHAHFKQARTSPHHKRKQKEYFFENSQIFLINYSYMLNKFVIFLIIFLHMKKYFYEPFLYIRKKKIVFHI